MKASQVVREAERAGYRLSEEGGKLAVVGPPGLPEKLEAELKDHKPAVLAYLRYRTMVWEARALAHRIDDGGERVLLPEYDSLLDNLCATENVLLRYGLQEEEIEELVRRGMEENTDE